MWLLPQPNLAKVRSKRAFRYAQAHDNKKKKPYCGGCPARSKALGSGPSLVGVQGFESLSPHNPNALAEITGYYPENAIRPGTIFPGYTGDFICVYETFGVLIKFFYINCQ